MLGVILKGHCECALDTCDLYGTLKKPWVDGTRCVRGCRCSRCRGKTNRRKGDAKARAARKALGLPGVNSRHEEHVGGPVRWEAKAGKQVQPVWNVYRRARAQSEASRPVGDTRPFVLTCAPDGTREQLLVVSLSDWPRVLAGFQGTE